MGPGDSEQAGRGAINALDTLPADYLAYQQTGKIKKMGSLAVGVVDLVEPTGLEHNACGVLGFWAWLRSERTGKTVLVVNGGVSQSRSGEWLPGSTYYNNLLARAQVALKFPGAKLAGFINFNGLNDAKDEDGDTNWTSNTATMFTAYKAALGEAPVYLMRYPATIPAGATHPQGTPMPTHAAVRQAQADALFSDGYADAPEGPWVEGPAGVHLEMQGNLNAAQALDDLIP